MSFAKRKLIPFVILILIIIAVPPGYYFYDRYQQMSADYTKTKSLLNKSSASVLGEVNVQDIVNKVGKLIELPAETPEITTVTDKSQLTQEFFANSQNGDFVLIYRKAAKAIIYRESINKIIEAGTINTTEPESTPVPTKAPAKPTSTPSPIPSLAPIPSPEPSL